MHGIALIVIDVQQGFNEIDRRGVGRNNPMAFAQIQKILAHFRQKSLPIYFVQHASKEKDSVFRPESSGFALMAGLDPQENEEIIVKNVNSAFIGTNLEQQLMGAGDK